MDRVDRDGDVSRILEAMDAHDKMSVGLRDFASDIAAAAAVIADSIRAGGTLLVCGNGGSAADAQHIAAEFVGRFLRERDAWPAIALHTNTSALTAISNDFGFDEVFARQVRAFGRPGDVLLAISTSGESPNVIRAVDVARERGLAVVGLSGRGGGPLSTLCDICLTVPSAETPRIQEGHVLIAHIICGLVEDALC
jgi:D-sedoheptulose 7-phosphate isomerase